MLEREGHADRSVLMEGAEAGLNQTLKKFWDRPTKGTGKGVLKWNDRSGSKRGAYAK